MNMLNMKKTAATALILSLVFGATVNLQPRKAHALIGLSTASLPLAAVGAAMMFGGFAIEGIGAHNLRTRANGGALVLGLFTAAVGVLLLDTGAEPSLKYVPLNRKQAEKLQLSASDQNDFNENIDEINAIAETVSAEMIQAHQLTAEFAKARWTAYGKDLAPGALTAVQRVSQSAVEVMLDRR
jgi:hypothetical protein